MERINLKDSIRMFSMLRDFTYLMGNVKNQQELFQKGCDTVLMLNQDYLFVWVSIEDVSKKALMHIASAVSSEQGKLDIPLALIEDIFLNGDSSKNPAMSALTDLQTVILKDIDSHEASYKFKHFAQSMGIKSYAAIPIWWGTKRFGVLNICSKTSDALDGLAIEVIKNLIFEMAFALHALALSQDLSNERELNHDLIETAEIILIRISHEGNILDFNEQAERVTGFSREEVKGKPWVEILLPEENRKNAQKIFMALMGSGDRCSPKFLTMIQCKDDSRKIINWRASSSSSEETQVAINLIGINATDQFEINKELEQVKSDWESVFMAIQHPIIITDPDGVVIDANPAACAAAKKDAAQIKGMTLCKLLHGGRLEGLECPLENLLKEKRNMMFETYLKGFSGHYLLTISPIISKDLCVARFILTARDLTEEKNRQAESIRAGQLASLGELAAGVAHEINNPINGIINYAQILRDDFSYDKHHLTILDKIIHEGERIAYIVRNLLSFSRQETQDFERLNMKDVLNDTIALVAHQLNKDHIILIINIAPDIHEIYGNIQQLKQVLLNFISNARYALNERYPTYDKNKKLKILLNNRIKQNKNYIAIEVIDYGTGIPEDIIDKIFDPFFSSKPIGEGTGLGLSISHGIIHKHKGMLSIKSVWGKYTKVIAELPAID